MDLSDVVARVRPGRTIHGISAVFLPFDARGRPDMDAFATHLSRTAEAGLEPAVNMDTGFGPELTPDQRRQVLSCAREVLGPGAPFVAGAMPFGEDDDPIAGYRRSVASILGAGGTPIVFPSEVLSAADVVAVHREVLSDAPRALAFELGQMFVSYGRVYDLDTVRRLMDLPNLAGLKHSSLSRTLELRRLEVRDAHRPDFKIYTGNDLAIDMVVYGSDYLLGLSTFEPEAFAARDRCWTSADPRFWQLNDVLQAVGVVAFRDPVAAYKTSAAVYLDLTGRLPGVLPHPSAPPRPSWEAEILGPLARRVAEAIIGRDG